MVHTEVKAACRVVADEAVRDGVAAAYVRQAHEVVRDHPGGASPGDDLPAVPLSVQAEADGLRPLDLPASGGRLHACLQTRGVEHRHLFENHVLRGGGHRDALHDRHHRLLLRHHHLS